MGKQPAGAAAATSGAANRKRSTNESGQRSIAAAFQAAKRPHHTNRAGKSNSTGPVAPDTTQLGSDQDEKADEEEASADDDEAGEAAAAGPAGAAAAESASFDADEIAQVQQLLLAWYDRVQRVLPWRRNPHHKPQQQQNPSTQPPPAAAAAAAAAEDSGGSSSGGKQKKPSKKQLAAAAAAAVAAAAAEDGGSSGGGKQKKPSKKQLAAAAEAEAALAAAKPAPAELPPQEFAYYVWVSEIMLQQTQVSRVVTYFNKWIASWPTVTALAAASQEQVNEVWAGLGYYRRARYLLEGAQHIVNKLGGKFPETAAELRQIPGVGPYTAAAVASIAFNDAAAAVDGNVIRVLARMRALRGNPAKMTKTWDKLAAQLLHPERPGCHNQVCC
ncbi:hypothetical protein OEZ86_010286 [Tetradesmus obliquus]|nr:hypothetical protein OEZ86_010286 [Tetradesmus obliquus]